jgi:hypothetical protein
MSGLGDTVNSAKRSHVRQWGKAPSLTGALACDCQVPTFAVFEPVCGRHLVALMQLNDELAAFEVEGEQRRGGRVRCLVLSSASGDLDVCFGQDTDDSGGDFVVDDVLLSLLTMSTLYSYYVVVNV